MTEGSVVSRRSLRLQPLRLPFKLLRTSRRRSGFLFDLSLGLVGRLLLVLQGLGCAGIGLRRWHIRRRRTRIRSCRHPARTLLLGQLTHTGGELFLEVVVHLLQVVDFYRHRLSSGAVALLAGPDADVDHLVRVWGVCDACKHITARQATFLPVRHCRDARIHHESTHCWIQRRRNIATRRGWRCSRCCRLRLTSALTRLCLLRSQLGLHFLRDGFLNLWSECHTIGSCRSRTSSAATSAACVTTRLGISCHFVGMSLSTRCISRLQLRRDQIVRQPERGSCIVGIRIPPSAIKAPPRPSPTPGSDAPINWSSPRVKAPGIKSRMEPETRVPAIVSVSAPKVRAVHAHADHATNYISSRDECSTTPHHIGPLHIATPSGGNDAGAIVFTHNRPSASNPVRNTHAVAVDRADRSVGTNTRTPPAL